MEWKTRINYKTSNDCEAQCKAADAGAELNVEIVSGKYLRLHVQNCHQTGSVDLSNGVQFGAVHGVLVGAVLKVLVRRNVGHHLLMRHKEVVAAVFLVLLRRSSRI